MYILPGIFVRGRAKGSYNKVLNIPSHSLQEDGKKCSQWENLAKGKKFVEVAVKKHAYSALPGSSIMLFE